MFETKAELIEAIKLYCLDKNKCILKFGNSNEWNVSNITDMYYLFGYNNFDGDISKWNVSNVTNMCCMFMNSNFNGDISKWDISNLIYGREEMIHLGAKEIEEINIIEKIKEGYEECPVTTENINGNYLKCKTCSYCFSLEIKDWIIKDKKCPHCRSKWGKLIIYSQS